MMMGLEMCVKWLLNTFHSPTSSRTVKFLGKLLNISAHNDRVADIAAEIFLSTKVSRAYLLKKIENKERRRSQRISLLGGDVLIYVNMFRQRNNLFI